MGKRGPKRFTDDQRALAFWSKVIKGGPDDCWIWKGAKANGGYGLIRINKKSVHAHSFSLQIHLGRSLRFGMCALHNCPTGDNPSCVNPKHLWEGTKSDNSLDMVRKGRGFPPILKGSLNGKSKLDESSVEEILRLYATGDFTQKELGNRFGVSQVKISQITRGISWRHIKRQSNEHQH